MAKFFAENFEGYDDEDFTALVDEFAAIDWELSVNDEELTVDAQGLDFDQKLLLSHLLRNEEVAIAFSKYSSALEGPSDYSDRFTLRPPQSYAPRLQKLWDAAFERAEERLNGFFAELAELPWRYTHTGDKTYYLKKEDLSEEQIALLESAPDYGMIKKDPLTLFHRGDYEAVRDARQYMRNRFHEFLHAKFEAEIASDSDLIASLDWRIGPDGGLVAYSSRFPDEIREDALAALDRRGVQSYMNNRDKRFIMGASNTVGKLWDAPDGETDWGRIDSYEKASEGALTRMRAAYEKIAGLPWEFDAGKKKFYIGKENAQPGMEAVLPPGKYSIAGNGDLYLDFEPPELRGHNVPKEFDRIIGDFRSTMASRVEPLDLGRFADLPWKQDYRARKVEKDDIGISLFALAFSGLPYHRTYDGGIAIDDRKLANQPYIQAIDEAIRQRQEQFAAKYGEHILALPWVTGLKDKITDFGAVRIYKDDMSAEQQVFADVMTEQGLLVFHPGDDSYEPGADAVIAMLEPGYEEANRKMIAFLAGSFKWRHASEGVRLSIAEDDVNEEDAKKLRGFYWLKKQYGFYSISSSRTYEGNYDGESLIINDLRTAISERLLKEQDAPQIPEAVKNLPWRFGGFHGGREIRLNAKDITEGQKKLVQETLPEATFFDFSSDAHFSIAEPGSSYMARAILEGPLYEQLLPEAQQNFDVTLARAAVLPWRKNEEGLWEVTDRELTAEQQEVTKLLPSDIIGWDRGDFTKSRRWYLKDDTPDQSVLLWAVESRNTTQPTVTLSPAPAAA